MEEVTIACTLDREGFADRSRRWHALAEVAPVEVMRTAEGLQLRFRGGAEVAQELRELAELERACCPFAYWTVTANGGELQILDVTAKTEEAIPAVHELFRELAAPVG